MGSTELRPAAQQALEALESVFMPFHPAVIALRAALVEPTTEESSEVEPVAWMHTDAYNPKNRHLEWSENRRGYLGDWIKTPLYAAPPQRKPLTREEAIALWSDKSAGPSNGEIVLFARAIERAHGIGGQP